MSKVITYKSSKLKEFLNSIKPNTQFVVLDFDETITRAGVDSERGSYRTGLIPEAEGSEKVAAEYEKDRDTALAACSKNVTSVLERITGFKIGTVMSEGIMRAVGYWVGKDFYGNNGIRQEAMELIRLCDDRNIQIIVLSATPAEIVHGALEYIAEKLNFNNPVFIFGSELVYGKDGSMKQILRMFGEKKTEVVHAIKNLEVQGIKVLAGVGDKPSTSDKFIEECEVAVAIDNNNTSNGERAWKELLDRFRRNDLPKGLKIV